METNIAIFSCKVDGGIQWFLFQIFVDLYTLSSEFWARQAQREVVKMKNFDFSY